MADQLSQVQRSQLMSRIRSKNTKPELLVRKYIFSQGLRFRIHSSKLPGKPDLILPKFRVAIFVHGCFWHGHKPCKHSHIPKTQSEYWSKKISGNRLRDKKYVKQLNSLGWKVFIIWECRLQKIRAEKCLSNLTTRIKNIP